MTKHLENKFYKSLEDFLKHDEGRKIAVAVSGGVDSLSLLMLVINYMKQKNYSKAQIFDFVTVMHVDHDLRLESSIDAEYVKNLANRNGVSSVFMKWDHGYNNSDIKIPNLQEKARLARYDMMEKKCKELGIRILLTGHHLDDVMENYTYRGERSAGILGLSSHKVSYYKDLRIIRPLQIFRKKQLEQYLIEQGIEWCHDKSNDSDKYERNKIRKKLSNFTETEIENLLSEIELSNKKADELNDQYLDAIAESCSISEIGVAKLNLQKFCSYAKDLQIYLLSYLLTIISAQDKMPRARVIEPVIENATGNNADKISRTLHNCQIFIKDDDLVIHKEISKISNQQLPLVNGVLWDNRFEFLIKDNMDGYYLSQVTSADLKLLKQREAKGLLPQEVLNKIDDLGHKNILFSLPVIKTLEKMVAIPHIFFYDNLDLRDKLKIVFKPNFVSRFTHYLDQ